jgi:hypothetical protein
MADTKNLNLWKSVEKSNPKSVKLVSYGSRKFNSIDAHSQIKRATEVFGVYGLTWGVENESFSILGNTKPMILYQATLWYTYEGAVGRFPIASSLKILDKYGEVDDEAVKKVATDALTKGLSKLGFNSDVFENKFADNRYVEQLSAELTKKELEEKEEELKAKMAEVVKTANDLAKKGDIEKITKLWHSNVDLQKVEGFREAIAKAGEVAKKAKND